jgi:hypothetical protein
MHEEGGLEISTSCDDHRQETNVNRYRVVQSRDLSGHYGNDGKKLPRRNPVGLQHPLFGDWQRLSMGFYLNAKLIHIIWWKDINLQVI